MLKHNITFQQLPAFILMGIAVAMLIGLLVVFAYVLLWGVILGGFFWLCASIRRYFSRSSNHHKHGRIIDYEHKK